MNTSASRTEASADVAAQLRDLERQGGGMARLAHVASALLLVAFSAGSLLSISHAAFVTFLARWSAGQLDVPDGISLVVNLLLVLAADVALLYAASVLRVLVAAGADAAERRVHVWAMVGASVLESTTYLYLAWQFDHPTGWFLWGIVLARAFAAPLFAAYLSMARPLPVAPRDVAYQAALASGKGVVKDVATLAADPTAPLHRKVRIYTAASLMTRTDRTRFDDIITAVSDDAQATPPTALRGAQTAQSAQTANASAVATQVSQQPPTPAQEAQEAAAQPSAGTSPMRETPPATPTDAPSDDRGDDRPPDGSGSSSPRGGSNLGRKPAPASANVTPLRRGMGQAPRQTRKAASRANARSGRNGAAAAKIRTALMAAPTLDFEQLVQITGVSRSTASKYYALWQLEQAGEQRAAQ